MNKIISKTIVVIIGIIITAIGSSLGMKAAVGVNAWDALSQSLSNLLYIKVGTVTMILNISCVVIQLILLKKDFRLKHICQILASILIGFVVNFMYYGVFSKFIINNYFVNILVYIVSILICVIGVAIIMSLNFISFPVESCCMVISKKINKNFGRIRQSVDIISIIVSLSIAFIFKDKITVREGTVIAMLLFGPLLDLVMKFITPQFKKLGLIN